MCVTEAALVFVEHVLLKTLECKRVSWCRRKMRTVFQNTEEPITYMTVEL